MLAKHLVLNQSHVPLAFSQSALSSVLVREKAGAASANAITKVITPRFFVTAGGMNSKRGPTTLVPNHARNGSVVGAFFLEITELPSVECSARLAASLGVDHGRLFAAIEDEVRAQLRYLAEKPVQDG